MTDWPKGVEAGEDGTPVISAAWMREPHLQRLLEHLRTGARCGADGAAEPTGEPGLSYVVGGAVRNTLLGLPVKDVDVATSVRPERVTSIAEALGYRVVPTGIAHGTVTVVTPAGPYEVTTFRRDAETDGRHARVVLVEEMRLDAKRRDFTINALYADPDGTVTDVVGGLPDIEARTVRFIGDADARIQEDYLRILRFFRFHAHYGRGRPDADGLRACARGKDGLARLSVERVWSELRRMLEAPDIALTLLWMRQTGVLTAVLPETERWGIDAIHALQATERALGWTPDPLLRLQAIVPPDPARMAALGERLKLSKVETERLTLWAMCEPVAPDTSEVVLGKRLYREGVQPILDRLRLALAAARAKAVEGGTDAMIVAGRLAALTDFAEAWVRPTFPLQGRDLIETGMAAGPELGATLKRLEDAWIEAGFLPDRDALIASALSAGMGE